MAKYKILSGDFGAGHSLVIGDDLSFSIADKAGNTVETFLVDDIADGKWVCGNTLIAKLIQYPWLLFGMVFVVFLIFNLLIQPKFTVVHVGMALGVGGAAAFLTPFMARFDLKNGKGFTAALRPLSVRKLNQRKPGLIHF